MLEGAAKACDEPGGCKEAGVYILNLKTVNMVLYNAKGTLKWSAKSGT
jgi:hypothetical protein